MKHTALVAAVCAGILVPVGPAKTEDAITSSQLDPMAEEYEVKKGDTLWDISARFMNDPFEWPEIWGKNSFIADPHWIYPGQTLTLSVSPDGSKTIMLVPAEAAPEPPSRPRIEFGSDPRTETNGGEMAAAPAVRPNDSRDHRAAASDARVLRTFDTPRPVFTAESYMRTGFISLRSGLPANRVVSIEENSNATSFDYVVIDMGEESSILEGYTLAIAAIGDRVRHPDSGVDMGVVVRMKGYVRVESIGAGQSRCQVIRSFDPINAGDIVLPANVIDGGMFDAYVRPETDIRGTILAVNEPMLSIHTHDILYIDRGRKDGVRGGDRFTIFNRAAEQAGAAGHEPIGEVEAVNVMDSHTAVVVVAVTETAIDIGDRVQLTARCRRIE